MEVSVIVPEKAFNIKFITGDFIVNEISEDYGQVRFRLDRPVFNHTRQLWIIQFSFFLAWFTHSNNFIVEVIGLTNRCSCRDTLAYQPFWAWAREIKATCVVGLASAPRS